VADLKRCARSALFVPPAVDEAVLRAARQHLERPVAQPFAWMTLSRWAAAAALLCIVGLLAFQLSRLATRPLPSPGFAREDLNHDGRVDILDAFTLARQLKSVHGAQKPAVDLNGDGIVDERDVTALAARAVQLPKGGRS
jgi:dockerin type I repeat protein